MFQVIEPSEWQEGIDKDYNCSLERSLLFGRILKYIKLCKIVPWYYAFPTGLAWPLNQA